VGRTVRSAPTIRWPGWAGFTRAAACALILTLGGCASLRPDVDREPAYAIADADRTSLGRVFATQAARHPGQSGFQVMASGQSAFLARAALADAAERTLDLQYYSVGEDLTTNLILLRILGAAERGVRVRILLDDIHPLAREFGRRASATHAGIQVRLFNPFKVAGTSSLLRLGEFIFDSERLNRRMHNKLWVTDNAVAIVGSRNLADEYFSANSDVNFYDIDVLAAGPIVTELSRAFDNYWNSPAAVPMQAFGDVPDATETEYVRRTLRERAASCGDAPPCAWRDEDGWREALGTGRATLTWAPAQLRYDPPDQDKAAPASGIAHGAIDDEPGGARTDRELLIISPYFVPSPTGRRHLAQMRERGVRVAVLTNSLASTDSASAHAGYARHRAELLREGIALHELRPESRLRHRRSHRWGHASPSSLHAKVMVQDRARVIVGSMNQDPRSRLHNTEAWLVIESPTLATELAAVFEEGTEPGHAYKVEQRLTEGIDALRWTTEDEGKPLTYDVEPLSGPWLRLWRALLGVLIPEHML